MKSELKTMWIENLTNGKYKQGVNVLRRLDDSFCCLGVLADITLEEWGTGPNDFYVCGPEQTRGTLSERMLDKVDLTRQEMRKLIQLNDNTKASFKEIAKWIEDNL